MKNWRQCFQQFRSEIAEHGETKTPPALARNGRNAYAFQVKFFVFIAAAFFSGCIPFAFLTPPTRAEGVVGAQFQQLDAEAEDGRDDGITFVAPLRIGLYPLQAFEGMTDRRFDGGVGYQAWIGQPSRVPHGPFLDFAYLEPLGGHSNIRLRFSGKGHAMNRIGSGWGFGGGFQGGIEFTTYANGPFESCDNDGCVFGQAFGEGGINFFVEASRVIFQDSELTYLGIGASVLIPATAGAGFVWIFSLL